MTDQKTQGKDSNELAEDRTELADQRTEYAEDRTLMANERTFAGWMRTGLAAVGIGLGFNALFGALQPWWLPRAIATAFIMIGIFIFFQAQRHGRQVLDRMNSHEAEPLKGVNLATIATLFSAAATVLIIGMWLMEIEASG